MCVQCVQYCTIPTVKSKLYILKVGWFSVDERDEPTSCMCFSSGWVPSLNLWLDMRWRPLSTPEMSTKSFSSPSWRHYSWDSVYYSCCSGSAYMYDGMSWVLQFNCLVLHCFYIVVMVNRHDFFSHYFVVVSCQRKQQHSGGIDITLNRKWILD